MALVLRTKGFKRINNPQPVLTQIFNNEKIVIEIAKNNWKDSWHRAGIVKAMYREGSRFVQLGRSQPLLFGKQMVIFEIAPVTTYQIQIILVPWLPWANCKLWEVVEPN